jgi:quinolinate synthase
LAEAHFIGSTSGIINRCSQSDRDEFIILTESGVLYPLTKRNPGKKFYQPKTAMICPNMKKNRPEDVVYALETLIPVIKVPEDIRLPALKAVERMLAIPRD